MHVYLDNMIWGYLVARPELPLNLELLRRAHIAGLIRVVGALPLEEEMMGLARSDRRTYKQMRLNYNRLTNDRVLLPLRERIEAEWRFDGVVPEAARYLDRATQQRLRTLAYCRPAVVEMNDEVYATKIGNQTRDVEARDLTRGHIRDRIVLEAEEAGEPLDLGDPVVAKKLSRDADRAVADWYAEADIDEWVTQISENLKPGPVGERASTPTIRLVTEYRLAQIKRKIFDQRAVRASDRHDAEHAAAGAYYDVIVTNDAEFRSTLAEIANLPYRSADADTFADELHQLLSRHDR